MPTADQRDTLVIHDLVSLRAWRRRLWSSLDRTRLPAVEFRLAELTSEQNRRFSLLAAGFQRMCGCASGGLFMTIAVVTMIGYFATHHRADVELWHFPSFLGVTVLAAVLGKLLGLASARLRLLALAGTVHEASTRARPPITAAST